MGFSNLKSLKIFMLLNVKALCKIIGLMEKQNLQFVDVQFYMVKSEIQTLVSGTNTCKLPAQDSLWSRC